VNISRGAGITNKAESDIRSIVIGSRFVVIEYFLSRDKNSQSFESPDDGVKSSLWLMSNRIDDLAWFSLFDIFKLLVLEVGLLLEYRVGF